MGNAVSAFGASINAIMKDKISLMLAIVPIALGITLYYFAGTAIFGGMTEYGNQLVQEYISNESVGKVLGWIVSIMVAILLYFIVNWTFVLVVSIIASPFNDMLSARVEKTVLGQQPPDFGQAFNNSLKKFFATIINELKKVSFILGLSVLAFLLGLVPFLVPVSIVIGAMVIASEFLDYSWSRQELPWSECKQALKKDWLGYSFGGVFFMVLIIIPVVAIVVPSWATSYFTVLWVKNNEHRYKITQ